MTAKSDPVKTSISLRHASHLSFNKFNGTTSWNHTSFCYFLFSVHRQVTPWLGSGLFRYTSQIFQIYQALSTVFCDVNDQAFFVVFFCFFSNLPNHNPLRKKHLHCSFWYHSEKWYRFLWSSPFNETDLFSYSKSNSATSSSHQNSDVMFCYAAY